ncbi:MAG: hypothetical protein IJ784_05710 [Ruminiclostridium sp.]|nr:hypothetical protein [Ruminiclostridium sp.]
MLKATKKITAIVMSAIILSTSSISSYATNNLSVIDESMENKTTLDITEACELKDADLWDDSLNRELYDYIEELENCELKLVSLNEVNYEHLYDKEIHSLEQELETIKKQISRCDIMTLDDSELVDIIMNAEYRDEDTNSRTSSANGIRRVSDPRENLVSQLKQLYSVYATTSTRTIDGESHKIVEVVVTDAGKPNAVALHKTGFKLLYGSFLSGSADANKWINEAISLVAQAGVTLITGLMPGGKVIPYAYIADKLVSGNQPANQISANGNALLLALNTVTTVKFTYIQKSNGDWVQTLSSNKVKAEPSFTSYLSINGTPYTVPFVDKMKVIDGGFNSSINSAITIYKAMQASPYVSSGNLGVTDVRLVSQYKGALIVDVLSPNSPLGL